MPIPPFFCQKSNLQLARMTMEDYQIPILDLTLDAGGYGEVPVDQSHPLYHEPLVELRRLGLAGESYYARTDGANPPYGQTIDGHLQELWCRKSVAEKLAKVNARLEKTGFELYVLDAYRPIECQRGLWFFFSRKAALELPDASPGERRAHVLRFVSDPSQFDAADSRTWPTHTTGAAVDLTLRHRDTGRLAEMGAGFDEMSETSNSDYFERALAQGKIARDDERVRNRRILHAAMRAEGFVNYPPEFWHFDWGNQMFIRNLRAIGGDAPRSAWYGYVASPEGG